MMKKSYLFYPEESNSSEEIEITTSEDPDRRETDQSKPSEEDPTKK